MSVRRAGCSARISMLGLAAALSLELGCASAPPQRPLLAAAPIELEPRCLPVQVQSDPSSPVAELLYSLDLPDSIRGWGIRTRSTGFESIELGFPVPYSADVSDKDERRRSLLAALMRDGALTGLPKQWRSRLAYHGIRASVHSEERHMWLALRFPREARRVATELFGEWLKIVPPDPEVEAFTRRAVALEALARNAAPDRMAGQAFETLLQSNAGVEVSALSPASSIETFAREMLGREHVIVLFASPDDKAVANEELGQLLAFLPRTSDVDARSARSKESGAPGEIESVAMQDGERGEQISSRVFVVDRPKAPQVQVWVGLPTVPEPHPDFAALEMWGSLLGGNVGGRLFRDLRERQGLAYIINAEQSAAGRFVVTTSARPERVPALLSGIEAHLDRVGAAEVLPCEHAMLKARMLGQMHLLEDDPERLLARMRHEIALGVDPSSSLERRRRYASVEMVDLQRVAREWLARRATVVLVGDRDVLEEILLRAEPVREVWPVERGAMR